MTGRRIDNDTNRENTMNKKSTWTVLTSICAITILLGLVTGCGETGNQKSGPEDQALASRPIDLLLVDISGSFRSQVGAFENDMKTVVLDCASRGRTLWVAAFDGSPKRFVTFGPKVNFAQIPDQVASNPTLSDRFTGARALGTANQVERTVAETPVMAAGSGQLEALEVIASTPKVGRAFVITDLVSVEIDGVNLGTATKSDLKAAVGRWLPRLGSGLDGVQVLFVGVGRQAGRSAVVRNAEWLFTRLVEKAGGTVSVTKELPPDLAPSGGAR